MGPVPIDEAASRTPAYCTSRYSGWAVYDLAGISARSAGLLNEVTAWSLLLANALNGRVEIKQIADFDRTRRREFADRIGRIPADQDLHCMADDEIAAVVRALTAVLRLMERHRSAGCLLRRPHSSPAIPHGQPAHQPGAAHHGRRKGQEAGRPCQWPSFAGRPPGFLSLQSGGRVFG